MKQILLAVVLIAGWSLCAAGDEVSLSAIEQAFAGNDIDRLKQFRLSLQKTASAPDYKALFLDYRLSAALLQSERKTEAKPVLSEALPEAAALLQSEPDNSEYQTLLAALYGLDIIAHPLSVLSHKKKAENALQHALSLDPDNPRALLVRGVSEFQTPWPFGGRAEEARELLERGVDAFESQAQVINWGLADLHMWLGRCYARLDQPEKAADHYRRALKISPDNWWVLQAMRGDGFNFEQ